MKISVSTWDKYSASERELFQKLIPFASTVNEIKSFITAIKKRFGTVDGVVIHKINCVVVGGHLSFWNTDAKRWADTNIKTHEDNDKP